MSIRFISCHNTNKFYTLDKVQSTFNHGYWNLISKLGLKWRHYQLWSHAIELATNWQQTDNKLTTDRATTWHLTSTRPVYSWPTFFRNVMGGGEGALSRLKAWPSYHDQHRGCMIKAQSYNSTNWRKIMPSNHTQTLWRSKKQLKPNIQRKESYNGIAKSCPCFILRIYSNIPDPNFKLKNIPNIHGRYGRRRAAVMFERFSQ